MEKSRHPRKARDGAKELETSSGNLFERPLTRAQFLRLVGVGGLSLSALSVMSCQQGTPAPAPTQAPAAATKAPAAAPTSTPAGAPQIGKSLIGKLEGPEIVTDAAKFPKTFKEAAALAELVKAGKLAPVDQRIGQDPLVVKPVHEIGKYGGTWRRGFTGTGDGPNGIRAASGPDNLMFVDYTAKKVVPNIAKSWELSADGKVTTISLRRGMKWSDGQPFTADDIMFWYEDVYLNKDLTPTPSAVMAAKGKQGVVEKVDAYTVRWRFSEPYFLLPLVMAEGTALAGHWGYSSGGAGGCFLPAHYLKQYHPKYVSQADLDAKVKEAKYDNWVNLFKFKLNPSLNVDVPVVSPWKTTSPINSPTWSFERNPYSIWVDTEGNQLPYIDRIVMTLGETLEVVNLRAIAGEIDEQERHLDLSKLPVFLENQQKGNYKMYLDPAEFGSDCALYFNQTYEGDAEVAKWITNRDFRRALAIGIDRNQINETFWLGTGTPGSVVPMENNQYFPGPEYRTMWATYDLQKANSMLDQLGLDKKDSEGYRLRTDGKGRLRLEIMTAASYMQFTQICEMVATQWKKIGIMGEVKEMERSLTVTRNAANESQISVWGTEGSDDIIIIPQTAFPARPSNVWTIGELYAKWYQSGGTQGKEPPARIREMMDKCQLAFGVPDAERIQLAKDIWKIAAEDVYAIGLVGGAAQGVRIAKLNMGNIPSRQYQSSGFWTPAPSRPVTFYWKS